MSDWVWWMLDGLNPVSWWNYLLTPTFQPLRLDNQPVGFTLQPSETVTLELSISAAFQEKMQQLAAVNVGVGKQTRIEVQAKVLEGRVHNLQLVQDSPYNTQKLISLDDTPEGEMCILCLDRVNSDMFAPRKWYVTFVSSVIGCKLTVSGRIVTLTTTVTADKQRLVTEHLHSPALLHYGLDQQHQDNMATVTASKAAATPAPTAPTPAPEAPYHAMEGSEPDSKV